jgi:hypothetical protein
MGNYMLGYINNMCKSDEGFSVGYNYRKAWRMSEHCFYGGV